jgi:transcriptional regulator with XRE-family HTH domain
MPRCPHCDQEIPEPPSGAELKRQRKAAGLTQRELAARLNVSHTYVCKLEKGALPVSVGIPRRWRKACGAE